MKFDLGKAIEQFDNDVDAFHQYVSKNRALSECADAIMALRNLGETERTNALNVLCYGDIVGSFLDDFACVLNGDEYMRVPNALSRLIGKLEYNIVDDGYLRLCKLGVIDDFSKKVSSSNDLVKPECCPTSYNYFLSTNENWEKQLDVANEWLKRQGGIWINPEVVSFEMVWFENIENFTALLKILGSTNNYNKLSMLKNNIIEKFFKSRREQ